VVADEEGVLENEIDVDIEDVNERDGD